MISKELYTKIFLQQKEKSIDAANVKLHLHKWWQSHRNKDAGGLRLTEEGFSFLTTELELKCYEVPFTESIDLSPQVIIFFDRNMDCPYFLTNSAITVFSEKKSFELYMFSDDIRKYGLIKAMNRQNQSNQTDHDSQESV
jgi:hypothetical protein